MPSAESRILGGRYRVDRELGRGPLTVSWLVEIPDWLIQTSLAWLLADIRHNHIP